MGHASPCRRDAALNYATLFRNISFLHPDIRRSANAKRDPDIRKSAGATARSSLPSLRELADVTLIRE